MKHYFKVSAKDVVVHQEINVHEFPTYGSAEAAIQHLPNGVYSIDKFYRHIPEVKQLAFDRWIVNDKLVVLMETGIYEALERLTPKEIEIFKEYLKPAKVVIKQPDN